MSQCVCETENKGMLTQNGIGDEYVIALYAHYLESMPQLLADLENHLNEGDPEPMKRTLRIISETSSVVSATRVAKLALQTEGTLERLPFISRTFLALEFSRLHMEFLAVKGELEFMLQAMQG